MTTINLKSIFPACRSDVQNIPVFSYRYRNEKDYFDIAEIAYENISARRVDKRIQCFPLWVEDDPITGYFGIAFLDLRIISDGFSRNNKVKIIFAHRGTDSILDVTTADKSIFKQEIPDQYHHASALVKKTLQYLGLSINTNLIDIVHTGHSLGGALAQMCAHGYGHKSIGFETPGTAGILGKINPQTPIIEEHHYSFVMHGSYISGALPHRGKVFSCFTLDSFYSGPIDNVNKLHRMKNMRPCFYSTPGFIENPKSIR